MQLHSQYLHLRAIPVRGGKASLLSGSLGAPLAARDGSGGAKADKSEDDPNNVEPFWPMSCGDARAVVVVPLSQNRGGWGRWPKRSHVGASGT